MQTARVVRVPTSAGEADQCCDKNQYSHGPLEMDVLGRGGGGVTGRRGRESGRMG